MTTQNPMMWWAFLRNNAPHRRHGRARDRIWNPIIISTKEGADNAEASTQTTRRQI
jgi:hypothetical protein